VDLLVWSNQRLARWLRQVDLDEFVPNLEASGLHGAVAVLETSFDSETLATCLKIPSNRKMVRQHLASEFDALQQQARWVFKEPNTFISVQCKKSLNLFDDYSYFNHKLLCLKIGRSKLKADLAFNAKDYQIGRPSPKRSISLGRTFTRSHTTDIESGGFAGLANIKKRNGFRVPFIFSPIIVL